MPRTTKYPLAPLREHRDHNVEAATAALGAALRAREAANDAKRAADRDREEAECRAAAVRSVEGALLATGALHVADLARAEAWEHRARAELSDLVGVVVRADGRLEATRQLEDAAREALAQKKADLDVVVKDQARFDDRARRSRDAAEEEAADDAIAARRVAEGREG